MQQGVSRLVQLLDVILPDVLDDVPLQQRLDMWFMHDEAPAHFSVVARQILDARCPGRWIERRVCCMATKSRGAKSLWGHIKVEVYATSVPDIDVLYPRAVGMHTPVNESSPQRVFRAMVDILNICCSVCACYLSFHVLNTPIQ